MSKLYEASSCGFDFHINGPATVEEFDAKGGEGSALQSAVDSVIWRSTLPKWQREVSPKLEALTGVKREVDEAKTAAAKKSAKNPENVADVLEKFSAFAKRARAAFCVGREGEELQAAEAELNAIAQSVADGMEVDPSPSQRESGASKQAQIKADQILGLEDDEIETKVAKILAVVPNFPLERDEESGRPTRASLARAIDAFTAAQLI
jgi:hypothetical protein